MLVKKYSLLSLGLLCCIFESYSMQDDDTHSPFIQLAQLVDIREQQAQNRQSTSTSATNTGTFTRITPRVKFQDIVGDIPQEITELADWVCQPGHYRNLGLTFKGAEILLEGPPGTGKSTLAEAIASAMHRDMYKLSSSAFITSFQGSGAERIRMLFDQIRRDNAPVVIFIDEIDGLANTQANDHHAESLRTLYELQTQLDRKDPLIVCILATNNLEKVPAALRDRFAHNTITIGLPDFAKRLALLKHYAQGKPLAFTDADFIKLAEQTEGLSCRVIEKTMQQAVLIASEKQKRTQSTAPVTISQEDVNVALYNTAQEDKLPSYSMRKLLFNYYFKKVNYIASPGHLHYLATHSEGFSARSIQTIVQTAYSLAHARRSSQMNIDDIYAAFYHDQKITFPDSNMRARILKYYIKQKPHNIVEEVALDKIVLPIAQDTIDNFTGKELKSIVENAFNALEAHKDTSFEKNNCLYYLYIGLYKELLNKAEPASITVTIKSRSDKPLANTDYNYDHFSDINNKNLTTFKLVEIVKLKDKNQFNQCSTLGNYQGSHNYLDFINLYKPSREMRAYVTLYLLNTKGIKTTGDVACKISDEIEGLSCYAIKEVMENFISYMHIRKPQEIKPYEEFKVFSLTNPITHINSILQNQKAKLFATPFLDAKENMNNMTKAIDEFDNRRLCIIS